MTRAVLPRSMLARPASRRLEFALRVSREGYFDCNRLSCGARGACICSTERIFSKKEPLLDGKTGQFPCPQKYLRKHRAVQTARIRVAQRWVIGREKVQAIGKNVVSTVSEPVSRFTRNYTGVQKIGQISIESHLSETDDDADTGQGLDLSGKMGSAVANLLGQRFVARWRAANDRSNPGVTEF